MATLDQVTQQLQYSNERLDNIDSRFDEFFRQVAADRLDMLEMIREMRRVETPAADGRDNTQTTEQETGSKGFGLLGVLGSLGAMFGALELNAMGAVASLKLLSKDLKIKIPESFKSAASTVEKFATETKTKITEILKITDTTPSARPPTTPSTTTPRRRGQTVGSTAPLATQTASGRKLGEVFVDAMGRKQEVFRAQSGSLATRFVPAETPVGVPKSPMLTRMAEGVVALGEKAMKIPGVAPIVKKLPMVAYPLAGFSGYQMSQETPEMSTSGKIAVGVGGTASSLIGGTVDLAKLLTLDAGIELGQFLGLLDEKGYAQRVQDVSVQRDITDEIVRGIRDGIRRLATDEVGELSMQGVAQQGTVMVVNNNTVAPTTQNNVTTVSGDSMLPSSLHNNGTRPSAY